MLENKIINELAEKGKVSRMKTEKAYEIYLKTHERMKDYPKKIENKNI